MLTPSSAASTSLAAPVVTTPCVSSVATTRPGGMDFSEECSAKPPPLQAELGNTSVDTHIPPTPPAPTPPPWPLSPGTENAYQIRGFHFDTAVAETRPGRMARYNGSHAEKPPASALFDTKLIDTHITIPPEPSPPP